MTKSIEVEQQKEPAIGNPLDLVEEQVPAVGNPLDLPVNVFQSGLDRRKQNRKALMQWVRESLISGTDFGVITTKRGPSKPSLWKPGAEKICGMLGVSVRFPNLHEYEQTALNGVALKQIIIRCEIVDPSGNLIGSGIGARTLEQDYNDLNKALKMAEKSAYIDAVIRMAGLSEVFTQDIEDMAPNKVDEASDRLLEHNVVLRENLESVLEVKKLLGHDDLSGAYEIWHELSRKDQMALWVAPSKGGILTTEERKKMKSGEFKSCNEKQDESECIRCDTPDLDCLEPEHPLDSGAEDL